jgi:hypothetical protein
MTARPRVQKAGTRDDHFDEVRAVLIRSRAWEIELRPWVERF